MRRKRIFLALFLSLFMLAIVLVYEQYLSAMLGLLVGGLRVVHFWWNDPSRGALDWQEVEQSPAKRPPEVQARVTEAYATYQAKMTKKAWPSQRLHYLAILALAFVVIYFDKRMTFYTFFMMMLTVWIWFQVWLSRRVSG